MGKTEKAAPAHVPFYIDSNAHLKDELRRLDLLIKRRVTAFRLMLEAMPRAASSHPMYISHDEVDWLLTGNGTVDAPGIELEKIDRQLDLLQNEIRVRVAESMNRNIFLALPRLAHLFRMSAFEVQTVVVCLGPELERKYDKLYAYLQDDVTRKKPSIDLVLDLLCATETTKWQSRVLFSDSAPLFRTGILQKADDPQSPSGSSGLAQFLKLDPRIVGYLLGDNSIDGRLADAVTFVHPFSSMDHVFVDGAIKTRLLDFVPAYFSEDNAGPRKLILHFHGPYGVGKQELARAICGQLGCPLVHVDTESLLACETTGEERLPLVFREGLLLQSALYLSNTDVFAKDDDKTRVFMKRLIRMIGEYGWLTFLAGEKPWVRKGLFGDALFHSVEFPIPDVPVRSAAWQAGLAVFGEETGNLWASRLADQFQLTPGQIKDAIGYAVRRQAMNKVHRNVTLSDLYTACRGQSNQKLEEMAQKGKGSYSWDDLVLPDDRLQQLKEICNQLKHRYRVFGEWGFGKKLSHGKGLSVLFSGPPGTGKTMAAQVIAHDLQLDLYKIDLSGIVSKYIGETEKNLARVFQEAQTSNAILFFDEADALFGKRTEVSDAHDRYANIETSYLLQKMEEYEGMVILATNLRTNMDEAFTRRIRFIVEFPFPDEASRSKIWKTHFPGAAPLSDEIDFEFLSRQFQIAGGSIKNIVLNAAFLAAENGGVIGMDHVLHGVKREFEKIGKLWTEHHLYRPTGTGGDER
ncbi:MAG: ATP-dependent zinc metalloprotease FtsH [Syntrophorhabdus sp. PtaU1.Bin153]|nr:MAG: ATP-dependent zinc metalloprotease FtsH [Syntrophorhabdus sp. PtaU1.Bin153]